jgi:hyperosmotically inducible protein
MKHLKTAAMIALLLPGVAAWADNTAKTTLDDNAINAKINTALIGDPATKARQIDVEVSSGIVQLNGFVDSAASKTRAEELARQVAGVKEVHNNLQVGAAPRPAGTVVDDGMVTSKVKTALIGNNTTKAYQINVTTREGVVQLSGFVDSEAAKAEAERLARNVAGVRSVKNDLEMRN